MLNNLVGVVYGGPIAVRMITLWNMKLAIEK